MKRLVIGGPEEYDDTFQDWPINNGSYNVMVPDPNKLRKIWEYDADEIFASQPNLDIHVYSIRNVVLNEEQLVQVWVSSKVSFDYHIKSKYWYNLFGCTDRWQRYYDQTKMMYVYEYYCFGKWHSYWEITNESLYRFAGKYGYNEWLIKNLIEQRNEMRCYFVERIDQTAKIGSGNS